MTVHDRTRLIGSTRRYNKYCICATKTTCTGHLTSIEEKIPKKDEVFFGKEERQTEKRAARETSGERNCLVATRPSTTEPGLSVRLGEYCVYKIFFKNRNLFCKHNIIRVEPISRVLLSLRNLFQKQKLISVSE